MVVYQLIPSSSNQPSGSCQWSSGTRYNQNPSFQNYLSLLVTPENTAFSKQETNQKPLTCNILPAASTEDESLVVIFPFELEKITLVPLFSGAALDTKPITIMYTNTKVDGQYIKLILNSKLAGSIITRQLIDQLDCQVNRAASTKIITANGAIKTSIGKIDNFPFEVNNIIVPIKKLQFNQNSRHMRVLATCGHFKPSSITPKEKNDKRKKKEKEKETTTTNTTSSNSYTYITLPQFTYWQPKLICIDCSKKLSSIGACYSNDEEYATRQRKWDNQSCFTCGETLLDKEMWNDIPDDWVRKGTPIKAAWRKAVQQLDSYEKPAINFLEPEEFHEHYQTLAPTREKQKEHLAQLNTQLCDHCLISCDFQYCNECDLIYNPSPQMIYTIPEEIKPISSCILESESIFNPNSNSDNNDNENTGSSFVQYGNKDNSNLDSDPNSKIFIALFDLTKKQKLKWFSNNNESIMPEHAHNTDAGFDLRYPKKDAIKLEPHSCTCIDLKIALEIPATTMVQLASKSNLAKKRINIRGGIIDAEYMENITVMLQNNSEKAYVIEPNEKIVQAIFLPLVKIAQLVLAIKRKVKNQAQLFEAKATICESEEIGLTNLYISAKSPKNIKIPIYNTTRSVIEIPKGTIIGYLTTEVEDQPPNHIPNFLQLCRYVNITSQTIYGRSECYLLQPEQLEQINIGNLDPL
ncbi:hypothetical protein G9A89_002978 [Geosiphon pyriformis]|nr:hypothetical protein G9A89_002978 [Geosiphon pyriformis]